MTRVGRPRHPLAQGGAQVGRKTDPRLPIICFSHLRWRFVWQRPQHVLTRLARTRPVSFVEEPLLHDGDAEAELQATHEAGVTILTPCLPQSAVAEDGFSRSANGLIRDLLTRFFGNTDGDIPAIVWYYTPMAVGALPPTISPALVVYDVMDELANFRGAPADLRWLEQELLEAADLVFTGGPSLFETRRTRHRNTHCFPSGVDAVHFARTEADSPTDIRGLRRPIVGFYGVLDERIDFGLVETMASLRPEWSFVLVGPLAKIDERDLARGANIHYPGMRRYQDLPGYLASFDAAILPFAINEATRFISPTKTLEYLAAGKPVVSTRINDVVALYGDVVELASTAEEFVDAIERLWAEPEAMRASRHERVRALLQEHDWDVIASQMGRLIEQALESHANAEWRQEPPARYLSLPRGFAEVAGREVAD